MGEFCLQCNKVFSANCEDCNGVARTTENIKQLTARALKEKEKPKQTTEREYCSICGQPKGRNHRCSDGTNSRGYRKS